MRFFEDFAIYPSKRVGITNLLSNITARDGSHKGGWARLLKCQLKNLGFDSVEILDNKDSLGEFDVIIFDLGAEYSGALNMFGGLDEKVFKRLLELKHFKGTLYSWRNDLPSVLSLSGRRSNASTCEAFKQTPETFLQEVQDVLDTCKTFEHTYRTDSLLIGDSHTPSVWDPSMMIERRDGRTLNGMVEHNTIAKFIKTFQIDMGHPLKSIQIHCGSIDVRHHLCREANPQEATVALVSAMVEQARQFDGQIGFTHTMGIEDESRDLPKTGFFKGTPFYGSWAQRNELRQIYNAVIEGNADLDDNMYVTKFPMYFFDREGKLGFHVMEKPQSVHLSPEYYRWNLDKNELRWSPTHLMLAQIEKEMYEP